MHQNATYFYSTKFTKTEHCTCAVVEEEYVSKKGLMVVVIAWLMMCVCVLCSVVYHIYSINLRVCTCSTTQVVIQLMHENKMKTKQWTPHREIIIYYYREHDIREHIYNFRLIYSISSFWFPLSFIYQALSSSTKQLSSIPALLCFLSKPQLVQLCCVRRHQRKQLATLLCSFFIFFYQQQKNKRNNNITSCCSSLFFGWTDGWL